MSDHSLHFSRAGLRLAAILAFVVVSGCAAFDAERWNIDRYRDERAVDIDRRLDNPQPIVKNPF